LTDLGFEFDSPKLRYTPVAFFSWSKNLIETVVESPTLSSVANQGQSRSWGIENELLVRASEGFELRSHYTYQQSRRGGRDRTYQPRHRFGVSPQWRPTQALDFTGRLESRSQVRAPDFYSNPRINWQWNLEFDAALKLKRNTFGVQLKNLLAWNREEIKDYPLGNAPEVKISLERKW
jgi:outer membrane receptor protein involved in Fe transport